MGNILCCPLPESAPDSAEERTPLRGPTLVSMGAEQPHIAQIHQVQPTMKTEPPRAKQNSFAPDDFFGASADARIKQEQWATGAVVRAEEQQLHFSPKQQPVKQNKHVNLDNDIFGTSSTSEEKNSVENNNNDEEKKRNAKIIAARKRRKLELLAQFDEFDPLFSNPARSGNMLDEAREQQEAEQEAQLQEELQQKEVDRRQKEAEQEQAVLAEQRRQRNEQRKREEQDEYRRLVEQRQKLEQEEQGRVEEERKWLDKQARERQVFLQEQEVELSRLNESLEKVEQERVKQSAQQQQLEQQMRQNQERIMLELRQAQQMEAELFKKAEEERRQQLLVEQANAQIREAIGSRQTEHLEQLIAQLDTQTWAKELLIPAKNLLTRQKELVAQSKQLMEQELSIPQFVQFLETAAAVLPHDQFVLAKQAWEKEKADQLAATLRTAITEDSTEGINTVMEEIKNCTLNGLFTVSKDAQLSKCVEQANAVEKGRVEVAQALERALSEQDTQKISTALTQAQNFKNLGTKTVQAKQILQQIETHQEQLRASLAKATEANSAQQITSIMQSIPVGIAFQRALQAEIAAAKQTLSKIQSEMEHTQFVKNSVREALSSLNKTRLLEAQQECAKVGDSLNEEASKIQQLLSKQEAALQEAQALSNATEKSVVDQWKKEYEKVLPSSNVKQITEDWVSRITKKFEESVEAAIAGEDEPLVEKLVAECKIRTQEGTFNQKQARQLERAVRLVESKKKVQAALELAIDKKDKSALLVLTEKAKAFKSLQSIAANAQQGVKIIEEEERKKKEEELQRIKQREEEEKKQKVLEEEKRKKREEELKLQAELELKRIQEEKQKKEVELKKKLAEEEEKKKQLEALRQEEERKRSEELEKRRQKEEELRHKQLARQKELEEQERKRQEEFKKRQEQLRQQELEERKKEEETQKLLAEKKRQEALAKPVITTSITKPVATVTVSKQTVVTKPVATPVATATKPAFGIQRKVNPLEEWARKRSEHAEKYGVQVRDFATSWRDGRALLAILYDYRPELIPNFEELMMDKTPNYEARNVELAFKLAEKHFNVEQLLEVDDLTQKRPEPKTTMLYISTFQKGLAKNK